MKNPFGKPKHLFTALGLNKKPKMPAPLKKETLFKERDVAILRECLAGLHKKTPPMIQQKIHNVLLRFAESVKSYCLCETIVHIEKEGKWACLNCGSRYSTTAGKTNLVTVDQ